MHKQFVSSHHEKIAIESNRDLILPITGSHHEKIATYTSMSQRGHRRTRQMSQRRAVSLTRLISN